ncbi:uncharacterized protein [Euphorbia lathyris]|uniref:uncharacterized protein isoform X1 n=1 Tax=Euphorbia lathyris TaxID=212925 RepID=UPI003313C6E2
MGMMENSSAAMASLLFKNLVTPVFLYADKSFINLGEKFKLLELLRHLLITFFLFLLRFLPSFLHSLNPLLDNFYFIKQQSKTDDYLLATGGANGSFIDSAVSRALSQILSIINDVPVSSRKYEVVRSLAERLIDENQRENVEVLREVNRSSLAAAFERTLSQLEAAMMELDRERIGNWPTQFRLNRVLKAVRSVKGGTLGAWAGSGREGVDRSEEKLAAELLWLTEKLVACGCGEEAVWRWASAANLAWLSLAAEPRLQSSLVKVSAFLLKQAKDLRVEETEEEEEGKKQQQRQTNKDMLMAWLPLLCRGSNGTDAPVLSSSERLEVERILEGMIETLDEEQEQVLSLWLHHFSYCPSSDWPNLRSSYEKWCSSSRALMRASNRSNLWKWIVGKVEPKRQHTKKKRRLFI